MRLMTSYGPMRVPGVNVWGRGASTVYCITAALVRRCIIRRMRNLTTRLAVTTTLALLAVNGANYAQTAVEPLHFHHMHLNSTDPKAAAAY